MKIAVRGLAICAVLLLVLPFFVFIINEREVAVVLRMGRPVREYVEPGIHFQIPFVEKVHRFPKTLQFWGDNDRLTVADVTTNDNKKIDLMPWAVWRIQSPRAFIQRLRTIEMAEQRVAQISRSTIRDFLGQYDLEELVRSTNRELPAADVSLVADLAADGAIVGDEQKPAATTGTLKLGRAKLLSLIREETQRRLTEPREGEEALGNAIEITDLGISQVMFVDSVRQKTFDRWTSEREAISTLIVKEGEQRKAKILNAARADVERIEGLGQKQASELKGKTDAEIMRSYAEAMSESGEFFNFIRTLQAYEKSIGPDSQMIMTTDSDFFRLLKSLPESRPQGQ